MVNIGQLGREQYGRDQCVLVGFGTHRGEVIAGKAPPLGHFSAPCCPDSLYAHAEPPPVRTVLAC